MCRRASVVFGVRQRPCPGKRAQINPSSWLFHGRLCWLIFTIRVWFSCPTTEVGNQKQAFFLFFSRSRLSTGRNGKIEVVLRSPVQPATAGIATLRNYSQTADRVRPTRLQRLADPQQKNILDGLRPSYGAT